MGRVVRQSEIAQRRKRLRSEGLVELDHVHLVELEPGTRQKCLRHQILQLIDRPDGL
jgi:hypothetical protein